MIDLHKDGIVKWCDRWQVREFYLFGSILRADFHSDSDIDVMVKFCPNVRWGFEWVQMKQELAEIFNRDVDLLTKSSIENSDNWMRRQEILATAQLIYVTG
ncbi:MAG: hypothetical protein F6K30_24240 [Cyanothece sp. SIO2G6]|nr:hypothetical protein [Cyanothece sp. SIO2G6]